METTIHKTLIRPWGKETLTTVIDNGTEYNFEILGDLTEVEIISRSEQMVTDKLAQESEEVTVEDLIDEKQILESEISVLKIEKAELIAEKDTLISVKEIK